MIWIVSLVLTGLVVVAIALAAVGGVTARLAAEPPTSVFDLEEAVERVADDLPPEVQARLSYDDVRAVIGWHLDYLEVKGVAGRSMLVDHVSGPVVAGDDEGVAWVLGRVDDGGLDLSDEDVVVVLDRERAYLEAIGAIGGVVPEPDDPAA